MTRIPTAVVREVPASLPRAEVRHLPAAPIDVARARTQHAAYVRALQALGALVVVVDGDEAHPDCVFVEDTAVVAAGRALATRPGAPSRRGEVGPVAATLRELALDVVEMEAPATLDGGDVLQVGRTFFVGRSGRTDAAGAQALADAFPEHQVVEIPVADSLHLKSVCSSPAPGVVLLVEGSLDPAPFRRVAEVLLVHPEEALAANTVAWGGRVIVQAGAPRTRALLEARGLEVLEVDTSELAKADGALTCLSLLLEGDPPSGPRQ